MGRHGCGNIDRRGGEGSRRLLTFLRYTDANTPRPLYLISTIAVFTIHDFFSSTHPKHPKWGFVRQARNRIGGDKRGKARAAADEG